MLSSEQAEPVLIRKFEGIRDNGIKCWVGWQSGTEVSQWSNLAMTQKQMLVGNITCTAWFSHHDDDDD